MSPTSSQAERWLAKAGNSSQPSRSGDHRDHRERREPDSVMSSRSVRSADPEASFQHASNMMGQTARGFTPPSNDEKRRTRGYSRYPDENNPEVRARVVVILARLAPPPTTTTTTTTTTVFFFSLIFSPQQLAEGRKGFTLLFFSFFFPLSNAGATPPLASAPPPPPPHTHTHTSRAAAQSLCIVIVIVTYTSTHSALSPFLRFTPPYTLRRKKNKTPSPPHSSLPGKHI